MIPALTQELEVSVVYWHEEVTAEEVAVEELLADRLKQLNIQRQKYWGATLYHPDNLPFDLNRVPEVFTQFRKKVERECTVDVTFSTPRTTSLSTCWGGRSTANPGRFGAICTRLR